jgi:hypothetical protein
MSSQPFLDPHRIGEMKIHISRVRFSGDTPDTSNSRLIYAKDQPKAMWVPSPAARVLKENWGAARKQIQIVTVPN